MARTQFSYDQYKGAANVKDFGAVGDGSTDDTAAIQAALDAMKGADGTGAGASISHLYFPHVDGGFYKITDTLVVDGTSGGIIQGSGGFTQREYENAQLRWYGSSSKPMIQVRGETTSVSNPNYSITIRDLTLHGYQSTRIDAGDAIPATVALAGIYIGNLDGVTGATLQRQLLIENVAVHNCRFGFYSGAPDGQNTDHASITMASIIAIKNFQHGVHTGTGNCIVYLDNSHLTLNGFAATSFAADNYSVQRGSNLYVSSGSTYVTNITTAGDDTYTPYSADLYQASGQLSVINAWSDTEGYFLYQGSASVNDGGRHVGQITGVRHYNGSTSFKTNTTTSMVITVPGTVVSSCMVYGNIEVQSGLSGRPIFMGINFGDGPGGGGSGFVGTGIDTQRSLINIGNAGNSAQILMGGTNSSSGETLEHVGNMVPQLLSVGTGETGGGVQNALMQWKGASSASSTGTLAVENFVDGSVVFYLNCFPTASGFTTENTSYPAAKITLSTTAGLKFSTYDANAGGDFTSGDWVDGGSHLVPTTATTREQITYKFPHRSSDPGFSSGDFWEGSVYYNTTTNKLRVNTGGSTWVDLH